MDIVINDRSELPIYAQIKEQLREQIISGQIEAGTVLPSIRRLAGELGISVITTTRAYSDLEAEGFITSVQGKGSIVRPLDNALLMERCRVRIEENLQRAADTAKTANIGLDELTDMLKTLWNTGG